MNSLSERAIAAIVAQLQTITVLNGYKTDAGNNVHRSVRTVDTAPAIVVWDLGERTDEGASNHRSMLMNLSVSVDGYVIANQADTGINLQLIKADIKQAILSWSFNGGVRDTDGKIGALIYQSCTTNAREDGSSTESVSLNFTVVYKEGNGNPYSNTA